MTGNVLARVDADRMRQDLFYLSSNPLPYRKVNYNRPGQSVSTLDEADAYITGQLTSAGYTVGRTEYQVQAFRCDETKPLHHWYAKPEPSDPWYAAANLEVTREGNESPQEIIQLISHKDSMSWIDSPGAHDNCIGAVANIELARVLATCNLKRSVRVLFCNEEHTPWTSRFAAEAAAERGDDIIAVLNVDSIDGKSDAEMEAGTMSHAVLYSTDEGRPLAELVARGAESNDIDLNVIVGFKESVNDDDGMFINAGFRTTVMNAGSWPYAESEYHLPGDTPDRVNIENAVRSTKLILTAVLEISENGMTGK
jgi:hypothetical protein